MIEPCGIQRRRTPVTLIVNRQTDLFYDYRTNETRLADWRAWMKRAQPPTLVVRGRSDPSFETAESQAYKRELRGAKVHVIDTGHFVLDEKADDVAGYV